MINGQGEDTEGQRNKKSAASMGGWFFIRHIPLHSAGDLTGTEASGADVYVGGSTLHDRLHALHVGLPGAIGTAMGMGYLDTEHDALLAKVALSHFAYLLLNSINSML